MTACNHPHGNRYRNLPRPCHTRCKCVRCRAANATYQRSRRRNLRDGKPHTVDCGPARQQIAEWRARGVGLMAITAATGLSKQHIRAIEGGKQRRVLQSTADAILNASPAGATYLPAAGTRRRLRALAALGFPASIVARAIPASPEYISQLTYKGPEFRPTVTGALAEAVARVYDEWCTGDGNRARSRWVRTHARKKGCVPPEAWTDATIDDPSARPWQGVRAHAGESTELDTEVRIERLCEGRLTGAASIAERREAVRRLHSWGFNDQAIAERIGICDRTVGRIREHLGLLAVTGSTAGAA